MVDENLPPRRRILLLSPSFPPSPGGIERTAGELATGLNDYMIEVVAGLPPSVQGMQPADSVKIAWAANDPAYGRRGTVALLRLAMRVGIRFKPELVLVMHIRAMPAARALARLRGARTMLVVHARELSEQPMLARAAVTWADRVVAVSGFSRSLALDAGADPRGVAIIHPGVTLPLAPPPPLASRPGPPTIVTVARMSDSYKGHHVALAALERLRARIPGVRWIMVGEGSLREELLQLSRARGLDGSVSFVGMVDDAELRSVLTSAHVFCLLSTSPPDGTPGEGFGIAFVEAGAQGLPVVAGRDPGVLDAVKEGVNGILVDPRDPEAAARGLERVLVDRALAENLAEGGLRRAAELAWPRVVGQYRGLIREVLARPGAARPARGLAWIGDLAVGPPPQY